MYSSALVKHRVNPASSQSLLPFDKADLTRCRTLESLKRLLREALFSDWEWGNSLSGESESIGRGWWC